MVDLFAEAVAALRGPRHEIADAIEHVPDSAGLYAIYGDRAALEQLALHSHATEFPVYVGKAEKSLTSRDLKTHFATGRTGQSTVRRSFAALLKQPLGLEAVPRNMKKPDGSANFAVASDGDRRLTTWMFQHLTLAVWVKPDGAKLRPVEKAVLHDLAPPLNLTDVPQPWRHLKTTRAQMAAESRAWRR